jgi:hypothetical protein
MHRLELAALDSVQHRLAGDAQRFTFGRITTVPAAGTPADVTTGYYTSDMVHTLTQTGTTHAWTLDPSQRLRGRTDTGGASGSRTNHYADDTDAPAWIAEDPTATHWTRNISAFGSDLAAIQDFHAPWRGRPWVDETWETSSR